MLLICIVYFMFFFLNFVKINVSVDTCVLVVSGIELCDGVLSKNLFGRENIMMYNTVRTFYIVFLYFCCIQYGVYSRYKKNRCCGDLRTFKCFYIKKIKVVFLWFIRYLTNYLQYSIKVLLIMTLLSILAFWVIERILLVSVVKSPFLTQNWKSSKLLINILMMSIFRALITFVYYTFNRRIISRILIILDKVKEFTIIHTYVPKIYNSRSNSS